VSSIEVGFEVGENVDLTLSIFVGESDFTVGFLVGLRVGLALGFVDGG